MDTFSTRPLDSTALTRNDVHSDRVRSGFQQQQRDVNKPKALPNTKDWKAVAQAVKSALKARQQQFYNKD
ncbi:unnamed protein product [Gongylonema pulchrum]|uniref:RVT_N domain-containing protein n=1 Tax=Gongylonema pulchrum TaxID=637853 RepID=A0A183F0Z1_9BILA|nr:unnamed protein product [Gongylonema pulchrum]VDN49619.1 unnamed protein product [Gongylonema pulchrum]